MPTQKELDAVYINVAKEISSLSKCRRAKVGAIIVNNGNIVSMSYNGTIAGEDNSCEDKQYMSEDAGGWLDSEMVDDIWPYEDSEGRYALVTKKEVIHAEMGAILKAAKSGYPVEGSTLYLTLSPCKDCAKLIIQSGVSRVVYSKDYRDLSAIEYLKKFIQIDKHDLQ
jgi:dCMP deaminase